MAGPKPDDQYNPVPTVAPQTGSPNDYLSVQSNPNQFGAQIGQSVQKLGATGEQVSTQLMDTAIQYQGMLNESAATDLNTKAIIARGEIMNKYKTMEGFEAVNARPDTVAALAAVRQNILKGVTNPAVARAFNMLDSRQEGYSINDANGWGATQAKTAATNSAKSSVQLSIDSASNPDVAMSEVRTSDAIANVKFNVSRMMQLQGYGNYMSQDAQGNVKFDDSPEGQQASAVYQQTLNANVGKAYENIYDVKAFDPNHGNINNAMQWLQANKSKMPADTYAKLLSKSAAPFKAAQTRTFAQNAIATADQDYDNLIKNNVTGNFTNKNLTDTFIGQESNNGKTSTNLGQIQPAAWSDYTSGKFDGTPHPHADINNPNDNRAATSAQLQYLSNKYKGDIGRIAVGYFSGPQNVSPEGSPNPWINDHTDKNGKTTSSYVSDITEKLGKNVGGTSYISKADYYRNNSDQIIQKAGTDYAAQHGDDPVGIEQARNQAEQQINNVIRQQELEVRSQRDGILKYVNGDDQHAPITDINQLEGPNADPQLKSLWTNYELSDAFGANTMRHIISQNSRGQAKTYGTDFWKTYSDVMSGKINDPSKLGPLLVNQGGSIENSPVTNTGFKVLQKQIESMHTPQGQALAAAQLNFFKSIHQEYTASAVAPGFHYAEGEQQFQKFMAEALPKIQSGIAQGKSTGDLFNPQSKDYVGNTIHVQPPKQADIMKAWRDETMRNAINASHIPLNVGADIKTPDDLVQAWKSGKITKQQAQQFAVKQFGYKPAPQVPVASFGGGE